MKVEPNKFYITRRGQLVRTWMPDGLGEILGAIFAEAEDTSFGPMSAHWESLAWREGDGRFNRFRRTSLDLLEEINVRASLVSYAKATDYCATYDNDEPDDNGNMRQGFGATELEAVMDLLQAYPGEERVAHFSRAA
jgi:hypothetical protein